jgi:hypothetical protein
MAAQQLLRRNISKQGCLLELGPHGQEHKTGAESPSF